MSAEVIEGILVEEYPLGVKRFFLFPLVGAILIFTVEAVSIQVNS